MNLSINPFATGAAQSPSASNGSASPLSALGLTCPHCLNIISADSQWERCPHCQKPLQIQIWPVTRQSPVAAAPVSDQSACFFHPDRAFQACCQRCGRFVCSLCDLQLGAEHICPACFERGRTNTGAGPDAAKAEWRYQDILYDSIAWTAGWAWILIWPTVVLALPAVIFLHVKYRKAPRSYLVPRSGWRFWIAYVGFIWVPLLLAFAALARQSAGRN